MEQERIVKRIELRPNGFLEAEPDNPEEAVFFHPIPKNLVGKVREGDIWEGHFGRLWDTNQTDITGRKMFVRYFIPGRLIKEE